MLIGCFLLSITIWFESFHLCLTINLSPKTYWNKQNSILDVVNTHHASLPSSWGIFLHSNCLLPVCRCESIPILDSFLTGPRITFNGREFLPWAIDLSHQETYHFEELWSKHQNYDCAYFDIQYLYNQLNRCWVWVLPLHFGVPQSEKLTNSPPETIQLSGRLFYLLDCLFYYYSSHDVLYLLECRQHLIRSWSSCLSWKWCKRIIVGWKNWHRFRSLIDNVAAIYESSTI